VGGGGGQAGDLAYGIDKGVNFFGAGVSLPGGQDGGDANNGGGDTGGAVTIDNTSNIATSGSGAEGIFAQSVGGGGGVLGAYIDPTTGAFVGASAITDNDLGDGGSVSVTQVGAISTDGHFADGIFAQSLGGYDSLGGTVTVQLTGAIVTPFLGSDGVYAESAGYSGGSDIGVTIEADSSVTGGSGQTVNEDGSNNIGAGVYLVGGANNQITNYGAISDTGGLAVLTESGPSTSGDGGATTAAYGYTTLTNESTGVIGGAIQIEQGALVNEGVIDTTTLNAYADNSFVGGDVTNSGSLTVDSGLFGVSGDYTQSGATASTVLAGGTLAAGDFSISGGTFGGGGAVATDGNYSQTSGALVFDVFADPNGGFDVSTLDAEGSLNVDNTNVEINFVGGANAQTFMSDGLLNLDTFFNNGTSTSLAQDGSPAQDFVGDTFSVAGATGIDITGFNSGSGQLSVSSNASGAAAPQPPTAASNITLSGPQDYDVVGPSVDNIAFASGAAATLVLSNSQLFLGQISGLAAGDQIDLADLAYQGNTALAYTPPAPAGAGTLSVAEGTSTINLALLGNYMANSFVAESDGHGGTLITEASYRQPQMLAAPATS